MYNSTTRTMHHTVIHTYMCMPAHAHTRTRTQVHDIRPKIYQLFMI